MGSSTAWFANWMLYHVPDLDAGARGARRVLEAGGTLVATTIGAEHMADIWELVGCFGLRSASRFSRENGERAPAPPLRDVERRDVDAAVFPDRTPCTAMSSRRSPPHLAPLVPEFDEPFRATTSDDVFVAAP